MCYCYVLGFAVSLILPPMCECNLRAFISAPLYLAVLFYSYSNLHVFMLLERHEMEHISNQL